MLLKPARTTSLREVQYERCSFAEDILDCPRCKDGKMEVLAAISEPLTVRKILVHLGLPTDIPDCAPARAPPQPEFDYEDHGDELNSEY